MNVIGKLMLEELSKNTVSNLSGQKKDREERYLHTLKEQEHLSVSSFLPLSDSFLGEKGEEILMHNAKLWNVHSSSRGEEEWFCFHLPFSAYCSILAWGFFVCLFGIPPLKKTQTSK